MPGIDAIRAQPVLPPDGGRRTHTTPPASEPAHETAPQGDTVDISTGLSEAVSRVSGPRRAEVAAENARSLAAPEPDELANEYGRAAMERRDVRFYAVEATAPAPLEIVPSE